MHSGSPPSFQPPSAVAKIQPRGGKMKPLTQALQMALFRVDRGDTQPRIVKLGELIARKALAGDNEMIKLVFERLDGKVAAVDDDGNTVDMHGATVRQLIELLVEKKSVKVVDVVAEMVDNKPKE